MVRDTLRNAPYGVYVPNKETDNHYIEEFERLYMEDCRLENLSSAGVCMNMTRYPQNWLHARNVVCRKTPMYYEPFGYRFNHHIMVTPITSDYECYSVSMDMGLKINVNNQDVNRRFDIQYNIEEAQWTDAPAPDYVEMPALSDCVNIRELGAVGDGVADDTAVFEKAIAEYDNIYVPDGRVSPHPRPDAARENGDRRPALLLHLLNGRRVSGLYGRPASAVHVYRAKGRP